MQFYSNHYKQMQHSCKVSECRRTQKNSLVGTFAVGASELLTELNILGTFCAVLLSAGGIVSKSTDIIKDHHHHRHKFTIIKTPLGGYDL